MAPPRTVIPSALQREQDEVGGSAVAFSDARPIQNCSHPAKPNIDSKINRACKMRDFFDF